MKIMHEWTDSKIISNLPNFAQSLILSHEISKLKQ